MIILILLFSKEKNDSWPLACVGKKKKNQTQIETKRTKKTRMNKNVETHQKNKQDAKMTEQETKTEQIKGIAFILLLPTLTN